MIDRSRKYASLAVQLAFTKMSHWARSPFLTEEAREKSFAAMEESMAEALCAQLAQLRGTAAKLGQILAMESGLVSESFADRLQVLQHASLPLRFGVIAKIIARDFGQPPARLFREFAPEAFASASLGQVHRAVLHTGQPVAVKILFPGIAKTVESDFVLVRALVTTLPNNLLFLRTLDELRSRILEETDYRRERANMDGFRGRDLPAAVVIPCAYPELSSAQVLTSDLLAGEPLSRALPPLREDRDLAGQAIWDFFVKCVFQWGAVHADPHAGNYLWLSDRRQLGVVDFGAVKQDFSPEVLDLFRSFFKLTVPTEILQRYRNLGAQFTDDAAFFAEVVEPYLENIRRLTLAGIYGFQTDDPLARNLRMSLMAHAFHPALQNFSGEFTLLHRTFYGVLTLLAKLEATIVPSVL